MCVCVKEREREKSSEGVDAKRILGSEKQIITGLGQLSEVVALIGRGGQDQLKRFPGFEPIQLEAGGAISPSSDHRRES